MSESIKIVENKPLPRGAKHFLILGPPGVGKSTLINELAGSVVAKPGQDPSGVTDKIEPFVVSKGLNAPIVLWDVPGYGGAKGNAVRLAFACNQVMRKAPPSGIIVCVDNCNIRIEMGNHFITEMVNHLIDDGTKWDKFLITLTRSNLAQHMAQAMPNIVLGDKAIAQVRKAVQELIPECPARKVVTIGQGLAQAQELISAINELVPLPPIQRPPAENREEMIKKLTDVAAKATGLPMKEVKDIIIDEAKKAGSCVIAGTQILTPEGLRPVEALQSGDYVLGANGVPARIFSVVPSFLGSRFLVGINGSRAFFTPEHLFRTAGGKLSCFDKGQLALERFLLDQKDIEDLQGSLLETPRGSLKVTSLSFEDAAANTPVYEIVMDDLDGTYFADGIGCASSFPEVYQFGFFFGLLSKFAARLSLQPFTCDYESQRAMMRAAVQLIEGHAQELTLALKTSQYMPSVASPLKTLMINQLGVHHGVDPTRFSIAYGLLYRACSAVLAAHHFPTTSEANTTTAALVVVP